MPLEIFGYIAAVIMGITLGLIGAGGAILTIPVLVYLFAVDAVLATTYSLFIVGITGLTGSLRYMQAGNIHLKTALLFGIPSVASMFVTRACLLPAIPNILFTAGNLQITKPTGLLLFFALIMLAASYSMIKPPNPRRGDINLPFGGRGGVSLWGLGGLGLLVGTLSGLVGIGGGFLITPALVFFAHLPMKKAVGTSLIIIAANSFIGFGRDAMRGVSAIYPIIDWKFLIGFSALAIVGIITGSALSKKISGEKLKPAFGWFVLAMGFYIIVRETVWK